MNLECGFLYWEREKVLVAGIWPAEVPLQETAMTFVLFCKNVKIAGKKAKIAGISSYFVSIFGRTSIFRTHSSKTKKDEKIIKKN